MPENISSDDLSVKLNDTLFPAFVLGAVEAPEPLDENGRALMERLLKVTETRKALETVFPGTVTNRVWELAQKRREHAQEMLKTRPE